MIAFFKKSTLQIILMTALLCFQTGVSSQIPIPDTSYLQELDPNTGAVSIQQVTFVFDSGRLLDSDWGQFQIDPAKWNDSTDMSSGYLNFFIMGTSILERKWVVRNLYVPSAIIDDCPPPEIEDSAISPNEPSSSVPNPAPIDFDPVITSNPLSTYFDLRPNTEASGRLDNIQGIILVSKQPLPVLSDILNAASTFPVHTISIEQIVVNAEGYRWVSIFLQSTITGDSDINMIGPPPNPPDPGPGLPGDLEFPIEVFQSDQPNVSCAENQCVPMAHANVFAYLQDRYDGIPLVWNLPHDSVHGIGKVTSAGDVLYWIPEPENSMVANVDTFTRRSGVVNAGVGKGSSKCQLIRGAFGYLAEYGTLAQAIFRHQGGVELYGEDASCDDGTVILGGIVSTKEGLYPTWEWMFEQLQLGRGVSILFGRYDMNGSRTSGHMVRVWGAASYLDKKYIYTLDDQYQGINTYGLRTQQWEVEDIGQPGLAGVPDGRLNMNGTSWEIEFALSVEAVPTLMIP